jgi:hypothetical protein
MSNGMVIGEIGFGGRDGIVDMTVDREMVRVSYINVAVSRFHL